LPVPEIDVILLYSASIHNDEFEALNEREQRKRAGGRWHQGSRQRTTFVSAGGREILNEAKDLAFSRREFRQLNAKTGCGKTRRSNSEARTQ